MQQFPSNAAIEAEHPACASCRKRKLKCSRDLPTCQNCNKSGSECFYFHKRKPGVRVGAIESLSRRLGVLEGMLLDEDGQPIVDLLDLAKHSGLSTPAKPKAAPRHTGDASRDSQLTSEESDDEDDVDSVHSSQAPHSVPRREIILPPKHGLKRKADDMLEDTRHGRADYDSVLPPRDVVIMLVDYFCVSFQHWLPFVNKPRLQAKARGSTWPTGLQLLLHAIVAACLPHVDAGKLTLDRPASKIVSDCRDVVMRRAIGELSIASLQSLVVLVSDLLNSGHHEQAWPLISSLTRAVDYLQLTVDSSLDRPRSLMRPLRLLDPTDDWTELEEHRRLFWVVFLFDRFCTVHNGWNTSLTSEDVHQRLPADGYYFTREEPVLTPIFGIWNASEARIGRSLMNAPAPYTPNDQADTPVSHRSARSPIRNAPGKFADASHLGAFAYCIEATESLCQVVAYFICQPVDWKSKKDVLDWLTRFKELDLRLVHWKILLPPKWRDSNIAMEGQPVNMDPNLTLAHLSHNTSMTLLHYPIAYPPPAWTKTIPLPSACSAETCRLAASETLQIVTKFLETTEIDFVNHQFTFCVYIAAKALLGGPLAQSDALILDALVECLDQISSRWLRGQLERDEQRLTLAAQYSKHIQHLRRQREADPGFLFDFFDHSGRSSTVMTSVSSDSTFVPPTRPQTGDPRMDFNTLCHPTPHPQSDRQAHRASSDMSSMTNASVQASPPGQPPVSQWAARSSDRRQSTASSVPLYPQPDWSAPSDGMYQRFPQGAPAPQPGVAAIQQPTPQSHSQTPPAWQVHQQGAEAQLADLTAMFMDPRFGNLDRVISFDDANFFMPQNGYAPYQ